MQAAASAYMYRALHWQHHKGHSGAVLSAVHTNPVILLWQQSVHSQLEAASIHNKWRGAFPTGAIGANTHQSHLQLHSSTNPPFPPCLDKSCGSPERQRTPPVLFDPQSLQQQAVQSAQIVTSKGQSLAATQAIPHADSHCTNSRILLAE